METREYDVDCMKYRKSTHIASVDVDAIIAEKGKCELTIKLAYYDRNIDVNGKKQDGYFIEFEEDVKDMIVNSGNRGKISKLVKDFKNISAVESRNCINWKGLKLNLIIDHNRKLKGQTVDGIDIDTTYNQPIKHTLQEAKDSFSKVDSRASFVLSMTTFKEFMQNEEILSECKKLAVKFPNTESK